MFSAEHRPSAPLSSFVELFWYYKGMRKEHAAERIVPGGTVELVFQLRNNRLSVLDENHPKRRKMHVGPLVSGPQTGYSLSDTSEHDHLLGVHFKAGGAFPVLGLPAAELVDQFVPLNALWGQRSEDLTERIHEAIHGPMVHAHLSVHEQNHKRVSKAFQILEATLTKALVHLTLHPSIAYSLQLVHSASQFPQTRQLASTVGRSQKSLIASFRKWTGYTPNQYTRLVRFQRAIRRMYSNLYGSLTELSYDCGYFDQAHFIKDFKAYSGLAPSDYAGQRTHDSNHIAVDFP